MSLEVKKPLSEQMAVQSVKTSHNSLELVFVRFPKYNAYPDY